MALKDVIKEARLKENLKQEDAAKSIGVTIQTYSKWENGKTEPKASQISKISKLLNISTNEICNGKKNKKIELIQFIKKVSEISKYVNDVELIIAIWESIDNDYKYINNLENYSNNPRQHINNEKDYESMIYEIEKTNNPEFEDERMEFLKDLNDNDKEIEFLKNLNEEEIESYIKIKK